MPGQLGRLLEPISSLFFPPVCYVCGRTTASAELRLNVCTGCWKCVREAGETVCFRCGRPLESEALRDLASTYYCSDCRGSRRPYTLMRSLYIYEPPLREMIHLFKFEGMVDIGAEFGRRLASWAAHQSDFAAAQVVVPVPLHPLRRLMRGFNQSALLAGGVSEKLGLPLLPNGLVRQRNTPPQSSLAPEERRRNVKGAFAVPRRAPIRKKTVLLIDDMVTTETTVRECARTLKRGGAGQVFVLTLARPV